MYYQGGGTLTTNSKYLDPFSINDFPEDKTIVPNSLKLKGDDEPKFPMCFTDIAYNSSNPNLKLDILMPPVYVPETGINDQRKFPLLLWIQGSAFAKQEIGLHIPHLVEFARKGYVIAAIGYQGTEAGGVFPSTIRDTNCAIDFLLEHAEQYHINANQLFLWGESSGAYTAIMTAITQNDSFFFTGKAKQRHFNGIIDFYGPTAMQELDLAPSIQEHRSRNSWVGAYFNHQQINQNSSLIKLADPRNHLKKKLAPFLIFHGTMDMIVPFQQSILLKEKLDEFGIKNQFVTVEGSNHGTDAFWSPKAQEIVLNFLKDNIVKEDNL